MILKLHFINFDLFYEKRSGIFDVLEFYTLEGIQPLRNLALEYSKEINIIL